MNLKEKIAICYNCCGPTFRKSAYDKIKNYYFDHENLYYCILTDDKKYFEGLERKNLIVNELKDFREEYPKIKDKEYFLESADRNDYAAKCTNEGYYFPFSTFRFNILQAIKLNIKNVALLCTDTTIKFDPTFFNDELFDKKEMLYNAVSEWYKETTEHHMQYPIKILKEKHGLNVEGTIKILDAAARMYIPENLESLKKLFYIWNDVVETLYENEEMIHFRGAYVMNDEYILAPIYHALNLTQRGLQCLQVPPENPGSTIFDVQHNATYERFWSCGQVVGIKHHTNYEEFLKINNLPDHG